MRSTESVDVREHPAGESLSYLSAGAQSDGDNIREHLEAIVLNPTPSRQLRGKRRHELVPVVLIDRSALCRAGLKHILGGSRFRVAAEHDRLSQIRIDLLGNKQGVILVGLELDAKATFAQFRRLKSDNSDLRILALSKQMDPEQLIAAFDAGANGFLVHDEIAPETLQRALELVLVDGIVIPRGFTKFLGDSIQCQLMVLTPTPQAAPPAPADTPIHITSVSGHDIIVETSPVPDPYFVKLSDREQLILEHLTRGAANKCIARDLDIAEATVKAHIKSLLRKLRVSNRTQAAMWAIDHVRRDEPRPTQRALEP